MNEFGLCESITEIEKSGSALQVQAKPNHLHLLLYSWNKLRSTPFLRSCSERWLQFEWVNQSESLCLLQNVVWFHIFERMKKVSEAALICIQSSIWRVVFAALDVSLLHNHDHFDFPQWVFRKVSKSFMILICRIHNGIFHLFIHSIKFIHLISKPKYSLYK